MWCTKKMKKKCAAIQLGITKRHINRLIKRYEEVGKAGFVHGNSWKVSKFRLDEATRMRIVALYQSPKYKEANFTHFSELLEPVNLSLY